MGGFGSSPAPELLTRWVELAVFSLRYAVIMPRKELSPTKYGRAVRSRKSFAGATLKRATAFSLISTRSRMNHRAPGFR